MSKVEDRSIQILQRMLDLTAERHRVLANNLANINTPGFKRMDLQFGNDLAAAVKEGSLARLDVDATEDTSAPVRPDGNSVQLETELSEVSKNAMLHQMVLGVLSQRMGIMRTAVTGRA